jgi:hypothetical protein
VDPNENNDYSIEIEKLDGYLHVAVGGLKVTPEVGLAYWREIVDACEREDCSKILLEHNFVEMISMPDMLKVIGPVSDLLKGKVFAFIDRYGHYDVPEAGKAILRGHDVKMQIFRDVDEAGRWLKAN